MTNKVLPLSDLNKGQIGVIQSITPVSLAQKLEEMGCMPNQQIKVLQKAPFSGPLSIQVSGYTLSIRNEDAQLILVEFQF